MTDKEFLDAVCKIPWKQGDIYDFLHDYKGPPLTRESFIEGLECFCAWKRFCES